MKRLWVLPGLLALMTGPVIAGVVYEIELTDHEQSPPKSESIQTSVEGRHLKMGIAAGGPGSQGEMIFHGDRREMVVVDHENKSYHVMDDEAIQQIAGQVSSAMSQMQEALKNVPEEQRAMVEEMMKQKMPGAAAKPQARPRSELKKTGERAEKNGYPCVKYDVLRGGTKVREMWVTDWKNVDGGGEVVETFEEMADFFRDMLDAIPDMGQGSGFEDNAFEHMKELGGFPVVTSEFGDDGSLQRESRLRSAKRQALDPDAFEPPAGYKRQEMFRGR